MNKAGPIIIIEDDMDDQEILAEVFKELSYTNEIIFFGDGEAAYSKSIQGFFIKPANFDQIKRMVRIIVEYWQECVSPNYVK